MVVVGESETAGGIARRVGLPAVGAGVGLALGGPVGAVAGAVTQPLVELALERHKAGMRRVGLWYEVVHDLIGMKPEDINAWAVQREERLDLVSMIVQAAFDTRTERKMLALARVLDNGVRADSYLEYGTIIISGLRELEEPHIRVLDAMVVGTAPDPGPAGPMADGAWCRSQLQRYLPGMASGVGPVAAVLVRVGMLTEGLAAAPDEDGENLTWQVLRFGRDCHRYLSTKGDGLVAASP